MALTLSKTWDAEEEQIFDRSYRLRYNKGQVLMDKVTYTGLLGGSLAGVAASPTTWAQGGVQGACLGAGLAVFVQLLIKPLVIRKKE